MTVTELLPQLQARLEDLRNRHEEVAALMAEPEAAADPNRFQQLSREFARLEPLVQTWEQLETARADLEAARQLLQDDDPDMQAMGREEEAALQARIQQLTGKLQTLLLPRDPDDDNNIFLEIRAGTGGDEAALFAGDLFRMYSRYAEKQGWQVEVLSENPGEHGGFREIIARVIGPEAFARLKFESGTHRVQRVPETESQGRIHTSACTVAILPELEDIGEIDLPAQDLRIDTFRASGAGGQHVNTTDSAIRITHLPTGIVVECQDERSQHKNKARALALLAARIREQRQAEQQAEQAQARKLQVGSGDRSQRIRTYNFPQGRVTDHRINLTLYRLDEVLQGELDLLLEPLQQAHQTELLAELAQGQGG